MSNNIDINRVLMEIRAFKPQPNTMQPLNGNDAIGRDSVQGVGNTQNVNGPRFNDLLEHAVNKVNDVQQASGAAQKAYINGDPNVGISDVMIASQKAGVAFDSAMTVRNRFVEAYKDIMSMPV